VPGLEGDCSPSFPPVDGTIIDQNNRHWNFDSLFSIKIFEQIPGFMRALLPIWINRDFWDTSPGVRITVL
jgi:hypothetical protein